MYYHTGVSRSVWGGGLSKLPTRILIKTSRFLLTNLLIFQVRASIFVFVAMWVSVRISESDVLSTYMCFGEGVICFVNIIAIIFQRPNVWAVQSNVTLACIVNYCMYLICWFLSIKFNLTTNIINY